MQLETVQDHWNFFKILCTQELVDANKNVSEYPIQDSLIFATTILDCIAGDPYEVTIDIENLSLLESMQIVALAQISLVDLPSIQRLMKRAHNIRVKYRRRIEKSGWEEKEVIKALYKVDLAPKK